MSFTGDDYHRVFEEACRDLPMERNADRVREKLLTMEWMLWEALRGVFFLISIGLSGLIVFPIAYMILPTDHRSWIGGLIAFAVFAVLAVVIYWICRGIFHFEFAVKVRGRRFGDPLAGL
ncbi:hypothetical protein [Rhizobium leguminosarum]|uniref:hypothetical protein n=1 Tax=Rhizobium leguminosarum TaxID=384 RepID=UPI001614AE5E|nr:hypothetical protein [Rhizobium leguminosarum]MBB4342136.1 hypothetical protein [Rhizobium leguminosarum]MBB6294760.1 hypothetical protein [Rhizobium leguminosarum]